MSMALRRSTRIRKLTSSTVAANLCLNLFTTSNNLAGTISGGELGPENFWELQVSFQLAALFHSGILSG